MRSAREPAALLPSSAMTDSLTLAISINPIRSARKAATASSLAALREVVAPCPCWRAHGQRQTGIALIVGPDKAELSDTEEIQRFHTGLDPFRIGQSVGNGGAHVRLPSWASTEPSLYCTME
jgi:hypothetical protein